MAKQKYLVECVDKATGGTEFRAFVARNPVEATSHAQLMGFIVGRVELAPGEAEPAGVPAVAEPRRRRRTRPAAVLGVVGVGLLLAAGVFFGVRGYVANVEAGLPPPEELKRIDAAREARKARPSPGASPAEPEPASASAAGSGSGSPDKAPPAPRDPVPKIKLGEAIKLGNTTFTPRRVLLAPVAGEQISQEGPPRGFLAGPKLMLVCTVRNDSVGQVYAPVIAATAGAGFLRDGEGRVMAGFAQPAGPARFRWDGQSFDELRPGEECTNVLICEVPAEGASGAAGDWTWRAFVLGSNSERNSWILPDGGRVADVVFAAAEIELRAGPPGLDVVRSGSGGRVTEPAFSKRMAGIGGVLEIDGVRISVRGIRRVSLVKGTRPGRDGSPELRTFSGPYLVMDLAVENTTDRPLTPMSRPSIGWCRATDGFGNEMNALWLAADNPVSIVGQHQGEIAPGQTVPTILVVEAPKIEDPGRCVWTVRVLGTGEDDSMRPNPRRLGYVEFSMSNVEVQNE